MHVLCVVEAFFDSCLELKIQIKYPTNEILSGMMEKCSNFGILADMLTLTNSYDIQNPVGKIIERMNESSLNIDNLIEATEAAQKLSSVGQFQVCLRNSRLDCFLLFSSKNF